MSEQRSPEWFAERCGRVTASRIADVMARTRSGWGASRANYMGQLIAERLTGQVADSFSNAAMQWGIEKEPEARVSYEFMKDIQVVEVGFIPHPAIEMSGASPDGLIGEDGLIEIKCPNTATHIDFLLSGKIDDKYIKQMQWQMECTNRSYCDFVSYDPRMPPDFSMKVIRVDRDDLLINSILDDVRQFISEIDEKISLLNKLRNAA